MSLDVRDSLMAPETFVITEMRYLMRWINGQIPVFIQWE